MKKQRYLYKNDRAIFSTDASGNELYRVDAEGNEVYPKRGIPFAKDSFGVEFYAKTVDGHEYFPRRKKKCIVIKGAADGQPVVPRYASGKQRYPDDKRGNQYYLTDRNGDVFPLRDENGNVYFARTKNGIEMIPVRYFNEFVTKNTTEKYHLGIDIAKNVVYVKGNLNGRRTRNILRCICVWMVNIPVLLNQILEYLNG